MTNWTLARRAEHDKARGVLRLVLNGARGDVQAVKHRGRLGGDPGDAGVFRSQPGALGIARYRSNFGIRQMRTLYAQ